MTKATQTVHEPLLRIAKRDGIPFGKKVLIRAVAILLALVVDALFIFFVTGLNPLSVYGVMYQGTFATPVRFSWALRDLATLLCVGIALAPAFKMRFWNIGAEGQVLIGGMATALTMVYLGSSLPAPLLFVAMFAASVVAGALWGFIPAWIKSRWNTNETLFTLMMNYVATSIVACLTNIMRGQASSLGTLNKATKAGWFPVLFGQRYTINIIVVLVLTFAMYAYLCRHQRPPGHDPYHDHLRRHLRPVRLPHCGRQGPDHLHHFGGRPGLHRHHRGLAGQVQHLLYGADLLPAGLSGARCVRDRLGVQPQ